jgi:predicted secreted protein
MQTRKQVFIKTYGADTSNIASVILDGANDFVAVPATAHLDVTALTVEAWVYSKNYADNMGVFEKTTNGNVNTQYSLYFDATGVKFQTTNNSAVTATLSATHAEAGIVNGNWYHIAVVYDGVKKYIYVNGVEKKSIGYTQTLATNPAGVSFVGKLGAGASFEFLGNIDNVRVWNVAKTATEIQSLMFATSTGSETGLVLYYKFDDNTGTTALNSSTTSGTGANGTLTSGASWDSINYAPLGLTTYRGVFFDFTFGEFSSYLNGGLSDLQVTIPRKFDNYGYDTEIGDGYNMKIYIADNEAPTGTQIYDGIIDMTSAGVSNNESVTLSCSGYVSELALDILEAPANVTTFTYSGVEIATILKDIIDKYRASRPNAKLNYSASSIATTGKTVSITFNLTSPLQAIKAVADMADANWYWRIRADNILYFAEIPATPTHYFIMGKDISKLEVNRNIRDTRTNYLFYNGKDAGDGALIYRKYTRAGTSAKYGRRFELVKDSRFTTTASVDDLADKYLDTYENPLEIVTLEIIDSNLGGGYDIESIKAGDTFKVLNISDTSGLSGNMLITSVTYGIDYVKIVATDAYKYVERELEKQRQNQILNNFGDNMPTAYTNG